jgi:hypothetical protein
LSAITLLLGLWTIIKRQHIAMSFFEGEFTDDGSFLTDV